MGPGRDGEFDSYPASECLATLGAHKGGGYEVGVVVAAEVHVQQLFLPEGLLTVAAGVRLLAGVGALVHDHVPLLSTKGESKSEMHAWGQKDTSHQRFYSLGGKQGCTNGLSHC